MDKSRGGYLGEKVAPDSEIQWNEGKEMCSPKMIVDSKLYDLAVQCKMSGRKVKAVVISGSKDNMSSEHGSNSLSPCVSRRTEAIGKLTGESVGNSEYQKCEQQLMK